MGLPAVAIGLTLFSGVMSAAAAQQQAAAEAQAYSTQAQIAERNRILADQDRIQAVRTAQIAEEDKARENRRNLASIRAAYGTSGLEMAGSPLDVLSDSSIEMALDQKRVGYDAYIQNREGAIKMIGYSEEAAQAKVAAKNAKIAGRMKAMGSLIGAGADAAQMGATLNA